MKTFDTTGKGCYIKFNSRPPKMVCDHCGAKEVLELPKKISELNKKLDRFEDEHQKCKEAAK